MYGIILAGNKPVISLALKVTISFSEVTISLFSSSKISVYIILV